MAMSEEEINALNDQIASLTQNMLLMNEAVSSILKTDYKKSFDNFIRASNNADKALEDLEDSVESSSNAVDNFEENTKKATKRTQETNALLSSAINNSTKAVGSFADALISNERGFVKYNDTLGSLGDGVASVTSIFGVFGKILGGIVKGGVLVAKQMTAQADATLKARDDLYAIGGAGQFTAEEVRQMGINAGLSSANLELLTKPLKSLGPSLLSFGGTAGEGAEAFARLTAVTSEQRMEMNRLGVGQEELLQTQADYIKLQQMSGTQISSRFKTEAQLQKESLAYVSNLRELAAITGEDVETIKQRQREAANEAELQIRTFQLQERANKLREEGNEAEALAIESQLAAEKALMETVSAVGDPAMTSAFTEFIATGGNIASEAGAKLALLGVDLEGVRDRLASGDLEAGNFALQEYTEGVRDTIRGPLGDAARYSEEMRNTFGLTPKIIGTAISTAGIDIEQAAVEASSNIAQAMTQGFDEAASARAALTEVEITAKTELDNFVASINPLMGAFGGMTELIDSLHEKLKAFIDNLSKSGDIFMNIAGIIAAKVGVSAATSAVSAGVAVARTGMSVARTAGSAIASGASALGGILGIGGAAAETASDFVGPRRPPAGGLWNRFIAFVGQKSPRLLTRLGPRLAAMAGMAAVPGIGWIAALVNLGLNISLAWELYSLWKEFSGSSEEGGTEDNVTQETITVGSSDSMSPDLSAEVESNTVETEQRIADAPSVATSVQANVLSTEGMDQVSSSNISQLTEALTINGVKLDDRDKIEEALAQGTITSMEAQAALRQREIALARTPVTQVQTPDSSRMIPETQETTNTTTQTESLPSELTPPPTDSSFETMLTYKLDVVIDRLSMVVDKLGDSVDIQDRNLRYSMS